jgi:hypothetical protein
MNDEKEQLIFAGRTVDIHKLATELQQTSFELVINPMTGACLIVNRHEVKRPPNNVVQFNCEGKQFLDAYIKMTGE